MKATIKLMALVLFILAFSALEAKQMHQHTKHGVHGMLLFGDAKQVYISHLPLFNHPHDQQVIAAVEISNTPTAEVAAWLASSKIITLVPQPFDLNRISTPGFEMIVDVYQGHFERGGTLRAPNISMRIASIIENHSLHGLSAEPIITYQLISKDSPAQTQHYYRIIDSKPAADHIVVIHAGQPLPNKLTFKTQDLYAEEELLAKKLKVDVSQVITLYLETNELRR